MNEMYNVELKNADQALGLVTKTPLSYPEMPHFNNCGDK